MWWRGGAVLVAVATVVGCAAGPVPHIVVPPQTLQQTVSSPPGILVVPASSHVTGVYPTTCRRAAGEDPWLPARACTPGAIRSDVDPQHLELTVCKPDWSASIRPPTTETNRMKTAAMIAYGIPASERPDTELDHEVPEAMGGASDAANLWPEVSDQPGKGVHNTKDEVETRVHTAICRHPVTGRDKMWATAVAEFTIDWTKVEVVIAPYMPPGGN
jgi:hypothetical protein